MIVCITGFGWSGSGAVLDLIREYSDVKVIDDNGNDFEFGLLYDVDGIYDLEFHTLLKHCRILSFIPIRRFKKLCYSYSVHLGYEKVFKNKFILLSNEYINKLIDFKFEGTTFNDYYEMNKKQRIYNGVFRRLLCNRWTPEYFHNLFNKIRIKPKSVMEISYNPSNFLEITKKYIKDLIEIAAPNELRPIVIDQVFPPDCPQNFFKYVDNSRCIVVRRDPRDTYLLAKCAYNAEIALPVADVESFICFYKRIIEATKNNENTNILNIQFEDLIYQYEETKNKIENFLGIKHHVSPHKIFNPNISINNTQLFHKYKGFEEDIKQIEKELPNSLYPFEKYKIVDHIDDNMCDSW